MKWPIILLFVLILVGGYYCYFNRSITHTASLIEGYLIPPIEYEENTYTIENGRVVESVLPHDEARILKIAYYALAARIDPIFGFPGMDPSEFQDVIKRLEASRNEIAALYPQPWDDVVYETLYPIEYFYALVDLEEQRRTLARAPSESISQAYNEALEQTIFLYRDYISTVREAQERLKAIESPDTRLLEFSEKIQFHTGFSTPTYVESVFDVYAGAAQLALDKEAVRYDCLSQGVCKTLTTAWSDLSGPGDHFSYDASLPTTIVDNLELIEIVRSAPYRGTTTIPAVVRLEGSQCVPFFTPTYYYLWWVYEDGDTRTFRPDLLNDIILYDYRSGQQANWEYAKKHQALGGPQYVFQPIANHYVCPDLVSDFSEIQSLRAVYEMRQLYDRFVGMPEAETILSQQDIRNVVARLHAILEFPDAMDSEVVYQIEELLLTYALKTAFFDENITTIIRNNSAVKEFWLQGTMTKVEELLYVRNNPKLLLGGFNKSIVPIDIALLEFPADELSPLVVRYSDIKEKISIEQLGAMLIRSKEVELQLNAE